MEVMNGSVITLEDRRQDIFMCLAVLLCEQFCRFANGGPKISIQSVLLHEKFFFVLEYSAAVKR